MKKPLNHDLGYKNRLELEDRLDLFITTLLILWGVVIGTGSLALIAYVLVRSC